MKTEKERKQMPLVDIFEMHRTEEDGSVSQSLVGRGVDGTVWMEPGFLHVNDDILKELSHDRPQSLQRDPETGRLLVEMDSLIAQCPYAAIQKKLSDTVEYYRDALHPTNFRK
jgi:hypothetical protein